MCCICVIQKWARWVATMLPWLVIPLIGLWALSQLLPPAFRFEITSSRLACVFVLLVTLFWYEILMPQLSAWRVRRSARLRERKRSEALELQKLRKTATRKCRNCLTPYRDQNPGGGKFMCSYCGHISKRPVLDLPVPPGMGISNSGVIKVFFAKGGKVLNGKVWSDNSSLCPATEWVDHGNWAGGSMPGNSTYLRKGDALFGGIDQCYEDKSYEPAVVFPNKCLMSFLKCLRWLWRKLYRVSSSRDDELSDAEHRAMLAKRGENGGNCHERRGEKSRRKAEEKRQARLEKELLEEEERKQREEVARLVEERRKLRDEKLEAENRAKGVSSIREKDRKEAERRRQERKKEKDKASIKSNSDAEELEAKVGKESERKLDTEKKNESDKRELQKTGTFGIKGHHISETGQGLNSSSMNAKQGNAGTRYFDRMKGTFLSSSRALTGGSFFSKVSHTTSLSKESKSNSSTDNFQVPTTRREPYPADRMPPKLANRGDTQCSNTPVLSDPPPRTAPKSWQELFTKTPAVPAPATTNVISRPNSKSQNEIQSSQLPPQLPSAPTYDNPIDFGFSSPFSLPAFSSGLINSVSVNPLSKDPLFPHSGDIPLETLPEEAELFEDPCYVPDPVSLIGPVSESLDNFQLDLGTAFMQEEVGKPRWLNNVSAALGTSQPSPIESPMSRLRTADEKQNSSARFPGSPDIQGMHPFPVGDLKTTNGMGTWQMWNTSPLCQNGLSFSGAPVAWNLPLEPIRSSKEDNVHPSSLMSAASLFSQDALGGNYPPQKICFGSYQPGAFISSMSDLKDPDLWPKKTLFPPLSAAEILPVQHTFQGSSRNVRVYGSPKISASNHSSDLSPVNSLSINEWTEPGYGEGLGNPSTTKSHVDGLHSTPDVQPLWPFE